MPQLPYSIELHDSLVTSIVVEGAEATVTLSPAYIHRDGKGWSQVATIVIQNAEVENAQSELPAALADGSLNTERGPYHNLLHLPLSDEGPVSLNLEFFSGNVAIIHGTSVRIALVGTPVFVEDVT